MTRSVCASVPTTKIELEILRGVVRGEGVSKRRSRENREPGSVRNLAFPH